MNKNMNKNKNKYKKPAWAKAQLIRESGLLEDICECGVGHPNMDFLKDHPTHDGVHGCCGCCSKSRHVAKKEKIPLT